MPGSVVLVLPGGTQFGEIVSNPVLVEMPDVFAACPIFTVFSLVTICIDLPMVGRFSVPP
jgi:hypothetical protein